MILILCKKSGLMNLRSKNGVEDRFGILAKGYESKDG